MMMASPLDLNPWRSSMNEEEKEEPGNDGVFIRNSIDKM